MECNASHASQIMHQTCHTHSINLSWSGLFIFRCMMYVTVVSESVSLLLARPPPNCMLIMISWQMAFDALDGMTNGFANTLTNTLTNICCRPWYFQPSYTHTRLLISTAASMCALAVIYTHYWVYDTTKHGGLQVQCVTGWWWARQLRLIGLYDLCMMAVWPLKKESQGTSLGTPFSLPKPVMWDS